MSQKSDNPFEPRLGRIRSGGNARRGRTFMSRVARSVSRAGPPSRGTGRRPASKGRGSYQRRVIIKARFVRLSVSSTKALSEHLRYISRDSAMKSEDKGKVFNELSDDVDRETLAENAQDDRHHFRLIVSPEDGAELEDMKPFVHDLVSGMESDLGTRLEWVAAVHDNTDHPHVHIVIRGKRDDGRDLVMPRAYISHGIRERAEDLVTLELGPETQVERDVKLARQTRAERLTQIDRSLVRLAGSDGRLDLNTGPPRYRAINAARLRTLSALGLARQVKGAIWEVSDGFDQTLKELGERRDIIKQIHKALGERKGRILDMGRPFSNDAANPSKITGAVLRVGKRGEGHDEDFITLDTLDGRALTATIKYSEMHDDLRPGMIVTLSAPDTGPRPADHVIARIADANTGTYSPALHQLSDPGARPAYIGAHVRRLEALRRVGIAERLPDGNWRLPPDYIELVRKHQKQLARRMPADVKVASWVGLAEQVGVSGLTWLDQHPAPNVPAFGFAEEVRAAHALRRAYLLQRGLISDPDNALDTRILATLRQAGLEAAGAEVARDLGKPYAALRGEGAIEGIYRRPIIRADGKFAIIERQRDFTLAPWRPVMERARGQAISGIVRGQSISWTFGRQKGRGV